MTTKTRRALKFVNQAMYVLSIAMVIASMMLSLAVKPAMAQSTVGSMWTTTDACGDPQNVNHYVVGAVVYINYRGLGAGTYNWTITQTDGNPKPTVASGSHVVDASGAGCFAAHTIQPAEAEHGYSVDMGQGLNDNYRVEPYTPPVVSIDLTKAISGTYPSTLGGTVSYTLVVTNKGNVALTGIGLSDPGAATISCPADTLAAGAHMTCSATHTINQSDLDAGTYTNTATVTGNYGTQAVSDTANATASFTQTRTLTVDKTKTGALSGTFAVGDVFNYTITVTNTGNVTLPGVTVTDSSAIVGSCTPANGSSLAPGAVMTCPASHQVIQADINSGTYLNTATGTSGLLTGSDSVTVTLLRYPALTIKKSVTTEPPYQVNDTVTYSILVTNSGNVTLNNVTVADPGTVMGICSPISGSSLAPGGTMTCPATHVITQAQFNAGSYTNTATADSNETSPQSDSATIYFAAGPALSIEKKLDDTGPFVLNDVLHFTIEVTNTGDVTLNDVTVTDPNAVLGDCTPINGSALDPLDVMSCPATHTVNQTDIDAHSYTNTATASSTDPAAGPVSSSVTVDFVPNPALSITKVAAAGTYGVGDTIPYTITARNDGDVTLHNVTITDPSAVISSCTPASGSSLAPGASMVCSASHVVDQTNVDEGSYVNTATADSDETLPVSSPETVTFDQSPNFSIVKSVTSVPLEAGYIVGNNLTYSILLTNTGNVTLHKVDVSDLYADMGACTPTVPVASLAPLGEIRCTASHIITQGDLNAGFYLNTAVGSADGLTPKEDSERVNFTQGPALFFEKKEVTQGPYVLGATITYSLELTNIGNVTLTNVNITDPGSFIGTCTPALPVAELDPLGKVTCTATHVVTAADLAAGMTFMNTATGGSTETDPQSASVTVALAIKGCTDPDATNHNAQATLNDGSCQYPAVPTPAPVPTLPIPATGGTLLIPVTGADLSQTLPAASLPRSLFLTGLTIFGVAMILSGVRRKARL